MRTFSWVRDRIGRWRQTPSVGRRGTKARPESRWRPRLEALEDRSVPAGGVLDPTFGTGGVVSSSLGATTSANAVTTDPNDGKIVVAGYYGESNLKGRFGVARYNPDGSLDTSFGGGGEVTYAANTASGALDVVVQPDGKVLAAGDSSGHFVVVRFNHDGSLDNTFGKRGAATTTIFSKNFERIYALALQPDGKIVAAGTTGPPNSTGSREIVLVRYNPDGTLDTSFGQGGLALDHIPTATWAGGQQRLGLAIDSDTGQIVVEAAAPALRPVGYPAMVIRYKGTGTLDQQFGGKGTGYVTFDGKGLPLLVSLADVAIQPTDHRIVLAGRVTSQVQGLARLNSNGTMDGSLTTTANSEIGVIDTIKLQSDGRILVGDVDAIPGSVLSVSRFNPDLSPDTSFGVGGVATVTSLTGEGYAGMALEPDGRIVVVGGPALGYVRVDLARFLASGPQVDSFTADSDSVPAGGVVTLTAANVAALNPDSTVTQVAFYVDSNGNGVLDAGDTQLTGTLTRSGSTWTLTVDTTGWAHGTYMLFAQAEDSSGAFSDPLTLNFQVL